MSVGDAIPILAIVTIILSGGIFSILSHFKKKRKREANRKEREKIEKESNTKNSIRIEQQRLGRILFTAMCFEADKRDDRRYKITPYPNNDNGKNYKIVVCDTGKSFLDCFQVYVYASENKIIFIDTDNSSKDFTLDKLEEVKNLLCEKIKAPQ